MKRICAIITLLVSFNVMTMAHAYTCQEPQTKTELTSKEKSDLLDSFKKEKAKYRKVPSGTKSKLTRTKKVTYYDLRNLGKAGFHKQVRDYVQAVGSTYCCKPSRDAKLKEVGYSNSDIVIFGRSCAKKSEHHHN